jgi:NADPH:quinone reductase-like Zn-dependent oxidoreductase
MELVRSIGAERVIDYTREDFTKTDRRYDLILDCVGNHPLSAFRRALTPKGTYVVIGGPSERSIDPLIGMLKLLLSSPFVSQRLVLVLAKPKKEDLSIIKGLVEAGKVTPVIDRRYKLSEIPEAIRYLETGHARGKVVITVD